MYQKNDECTNTTGAKQTGVCVYHCLFYNFSRVVLDLHIAECSCFTVNTMDGSAFTRSGRGRGVNGSDGRGRPHSRNMHWSADGGSRGHTPNNPDSERWERGGHRGGGRGRGHPRGTMPKFQNASLRLNYPPPQPNHQVAVEATQTQAYEEHAAEYDTVEEEHPMEELEDEDDGSSHVIEEPVLEAEEREKFYQEVCSRFVTFAYLTVCQVGQSSRG